jgi:hypothetical protein
MSINASNEADVEKSAFGDRLTERDRPLAVYRSIWLNDGDSIITGH